MRNQAEAKASALVSSTQADAQSQLRQWQAETEARLRVAHVEAEERRVRDLAELKASHARELALAQMSANSARPDVDNSSEVQRALHERDQAVRDKERVLAALRDSEQRHRDLAHRVVDVTTSGALPLTRPPSGLVRASLSPAASLAPSPPSECDC